MEEWAKIIAMFQNEIQPENRRCLGNWEGEGDPDCDGEYISFNGRGKDSHETFSLTRLKRDIFEYENAQEFERDGAFSFCKTNRKPYDNAVVSLLIGVRQIVSDAISLSSDGDDLD